MKNIQKILDLCEQKIKEEKLKMLMCINKKQELEQKKLNFQSNIDNEQPHDALFLNEYYKYIDEINSKITTIDNEILHLNDQIEVISENLKENMIYAKNLQSYIEQKLKDKKKLQEKKDNIRISEIVAFLKATDNENN